MTLREDQIQRYSRQILLKEVGGRGQARLLANRVRVQGAGPAFDVAVAYLAASGTPVRVDRQVAGFVGGTGLETYAPDAVLEAPLTGWLGPLDELRSAQVSLFRVALGRATVVALPAGQPAGALDDVQRVEASVFRVAPAVALPAGQPAGRLDEPTGATAEPVTLGALAALTAQRLALGLETGPAWWTWDGARGRWRTG